MKKRYIILCLLVLPFLGWGQGFQLIYGDTSEISQDFPVKNIQIPNENAYLVVSNVNELLFITKVDSIGNIVWQKQYDDYYGVSVSSREFMELSNGFIMAYSEGPSGSSKATISEFSFDGELVHKAVYSCPYPYFFATMDLLADHSVIGFLQNSNDQTESLVKISYEGELLWEKPFQDSFPPINSNYAIIGTPDGEILVAGKAWGVVGFNDVTKFDSNGNMLWQTHIPNYMGYVSNIIPFPSNDAYLVFGDNTDGNINGSYVAKISADGQLEWSQDFTQYIDFLFFKGVVQGEGNSLYMAGRVQEGNNYHIALVKLGEDGNVIWEKRYGAFGDLFVKNLLRDNDGGFFIAADPYSSDNPALYSDPYFLKTDANGEMLWDWYSPNTDYYVQSDAILTSDGGYLSAGSAELTPGSGFGLNFQIYLIKLDGTGNVSSTSEPAALKPSLLSVYPQPAGEVVSFAWLGDAPPVDAQLEIMNLLGQTVCERPFNGEVMQITGLPTGQLFYRLRQNGAVVETGRLVVR